MKQLTANKITENIISQVDSEGHHYQLFTEVTGHKRYESAITKVNGYVKYSSGNLHRKSTTLI